MKMSFEYANTDTSDLSIKMIKKLNSVGLKVIRVPIRMSGVSSQGQLSKCHINVKKIVKKYGGKRLIGHTIKVHEDGIEAFDHSVWITPEGKTICITDVDVDLENEYLFIPIGLGLISLKPISLSPLEVNIGENWKQECQIFPTEITYEESGDIKNTYNLQRIKELVRDTGGLFTKTPPDEIYFSEKIYLQKTDFINTHYIG